MNQKLRYNQKCYCLIAGLLLFMLIGYQFSFSDTFRLAAEIRNKEEKLKWLKEKERELPELKARMKVFENAYSGKDSGSVRDKLTAHISDYAENHSCLVTEIPVSSVFKSDKLNVQTNSFTIRGNFFSLLSLLYLLETDHQCLSKIVSARYFAVRDNQQKRRDLYLTIVAQSFEPEIQ